MSDTWQATVAKYGNLLGFLIPYRKGELVYCYHADDLERWFAEGRLSIRIIVGEHVFFTLQECNIATAHERRHGRYAPAPVRSEAELLKALAAVLAPQMSVAAEHEREGVLLQARQEAAEIEGNGPEWEQEARDLPAGLVGAEGVWRARSIVEGMDDLAPPV